MFSFVSLDASKSAGADLEKNGRSEIFVFDLDIASSVLLKLETNNKIKVLKLKNIKFTVERVQV